MKLLITDRRHSLDGLLCVPPHLDAIAQEQAGVLTRAQLRSAGVGWKEVAGQVRARRWQQFGQRVVVLHNGPLPEQQRWWLACLLPDKPAALGGATAVALDGLRGFEDDQVHIVVPKDSNTAFPAGIVVHNSRRFGISDMNTSWGLPRTRPARSAIDAAAWNPYPRRAVALLCAAVQQGVTTADALRAELRAAGSVRHCAHMRDALDEIALGAHTVTEIELRSIAADAGLGAPRRQVMWRDRDGKTRYSDAAFELPDGKILLIEIDGMGHGAVQQEADDRLRDIDSVSDGHLVMRISSFSVKYERSRVIRRFVRIREQHEI